MAKRAPMMDQYLRIKAQYPDTLLLFRVGDFYETFFEDAHTLSKALDIALTSRDAGSDDRTPLAGIPWHALDSYLGQLLSKGYKVAICEQMEDPKLAKGLVKRDVVRVVTPGTIIEDAALDSRVNNYLAALSPGDTVGLAYVDLSTGEFKATEFPSQDGARRALDELSRISPAEVLVPEGADQSALGGLIITPLPPADFHPTSCASALLEHFKAATLQGMGLEGMSAATSAAGAVIQYLRRTQLRTVSNITSLGTYDASGYMVVDGTTMRNLELVKNVVTGDTQGTLLAHVDRCVTPMGRRHIRRWLLRPLMDSRAIRARQDAARFLASDGFLLHDLATALDGIRDMERLASRCALGTASPRDLASMRDALRRLPRVAKAFEGKSPPALLAATLEGLDASSELCGLLDRGLIDDPPLSPREGGVIRDGFDPALDELRSVCKGGRDWILSMEEKERQATGIKNLRIGYNRMFGYYIEVTHANAGKVPAHYTRKQTLTNAERYVTPELKAMEEKVVTAQERIEGLEHELFLKLRDAVSLKAPEILGASGRISRLDTLASFARLALLQGYVFPEVEGGETLRLVKARHPTVERLTQGFVPNDIVLDTGARRTLLVTGPNMSGKSTYMRTAALIVIMAQCGAPVPAESAKVGLIDRVFTRVGAFDDLVHGQSTFMVEMVELANILNCATRRSLIVLDEIGRGTSTFDGLAIAWAVVEHVNDKSRLGARTMFATHYHELTELGGMLEGVVNVHIAISEDKGGIIFLREIRDGPASKSYGVEVAKLAGLPGGVIERAREVLRTVEEDAKIEVRKGQTRPRTAQMTLVAPEPERHPLLDELESLNVEGMTPLEAMNRLHQMRERAKRKGA